MNLETLEKTTSYKSNEGAAFCQLIFGSSSTLSASVSFRCVAEAGKLKEKLLGMGSEGDKLNIIKLLAHDAPLDARLKSASDFNAKGYAIFYLPTEFKAGYEESYSTVASFRAFVVDLDGAPLAPVFDFEIEPNVIVESSPGKFQCIWKLEAAVACVKIAGNGGGPGITCDEYNEVAASLAALFDGDLNVARATQPFRLPGFVHWKKIDDKGQGFLSSIYWVKGSNKSEGELRENEIQNQKGTTIAALRAALQHEQHAIKAHIQSRKKAADNEASEGSAGKERSNGRIYSVFEEAKIDLQALRMGECRVGLGLRHSTLLRLQVLLLHEGKSEDEITELCNKIIENCFERPEDFLGGARTREVVASLRYAKTYVARAKEEEARVEKETQKETAAALKAVNSGFKYDYSIGSMKRNRYTETAVAERVLQRFSQDLANINGNVYCFFNEQKIWNPQTASVCPEITSRVKACVLDMLTEPGFSKDVCCDKRGVEDKNKRRLAEAQFLKVHSIHSVARMVVNDLAVPRYSFADFDSNPKLYYCSNGVVDLESEKIRDATNEDKLISRSTVAWNPDAECPGWMQFLNEVFAQNDEPQEMIRFLQEVFAYSLSGFMDEQKLFCYQGDGSNGKSKTLDALKLICGSYHTIVEPEDLTISKSKFQKAFERIGAKVEGKRVIILDDFQMAGTWNEAFVKVLTGKEIRARGEYEKSRVMPNRAKFHIGMNKAPDPEEENFGILRRLCFIPYPRRFKESPVKSREIDEMIQREASGILRWAQKGFKRVVERGIMYPEESKNALEAYRHETFKVESAIEALFEPVKDEREGDIEALSVLTEEINSYFRSQKDGFRVLSTDSCGRAMKALNFMHFKKYNTVIKNTVSHFLVKRKKIEQNVHAFSELL